MKKLLITITLTAIRVAVSVIKPKPTMTIGSKDSYPQWVQEKFFVN